jgi:hypothetical protein
MALKIKRKSATAGTGVNVCPLTVTDFIINYPDPKNPAHLG